MSRLFQNPITGILLPHFPLAYSCRLVLRVEKNTALLANLIMSRLTTGKRWPDGSRLKGSMSSQMLSRW